MTVSSRVDLDGVAVPSDVLLLERTLSHARQRDYAGWDYGDGMSSRIRGALPFENRWVNLGFQELTKRAPINLRPLLGVEQRRNFKGVSLFTMANLTAYDLTEDEQYLEEARTLADWLLDYRTDGYSGYCGGHNHDLQGLTKTTTRRTPGIVGTSYAVKALLRADESLKTHRRASSTQYGDVARTAAEFVFEDLGYTEQDGTATINYKPDEPDDFSTINAVALGGRLLVDLYDAFGEERFLDGATKIMNYVAEKQTDLGGWAYRDPPSASHLSMDNHHNGFIIECFQRYHEVVGPRYRDTLDRGLWFYRNVLFESTGAPNWDETSAYPRDVHACAQGILVFSYAGEFEFAGRILEWTRRNLYAGGGRFYFRKHRFYTKRITLMRWCQAWMAYAISEFRAQQAGTGRVRSSGDR